MNLSTHLRKESKEWAEYTEYRRENHLTRMDPRSWMAAGLSRAMH